MLVSLEPNRVEVCRPLRMIWACNCWVKGRVLVKLNKGRRVLIGWYAMAGILDFPPDFNIFTFEN